MPSPMDFSALSEPIDPAALSTFISEKRRLGWSTRPGKTRRNSDGVLWVCFGAIFTLAVPVAAALGAEVSLGIGVLASIIGIAVAAFGFLLLKRPSMGFDWDTVFRLATFAEHNGLSYEPSTARGPTYPGRIFVGGEHSGVDNHIWSRSARYFDIGNWRKQTLSSTSTDLHGVTETEVWFDECGFVALQLDRKLPHIVLEAKANHRLELDVPTQIGGASKLELEGSFGEHFNVKYPDGYHHDALYILTPDLMALLIDEAGDFDLEIIDDWLFVYAPNPFAADQATYERLFRIVDTVGERAAKRSHNYRDERISNFAANSIAEQGRRLPVGSVAAMVFVIAAVVVTWAALTW